MSSSNDRIRHTGKRQWLLGFAAVGMFCFPSIGVAAEPAPKTEQPAAKSAKPKDALFPFTISEETTRVTKPLRADGSVDYAAALNERLSQGVTPENNAAVLLLQAAGAEAVPESIRKRFFEQLGIPVPGGESALLPTTPRIDTYTRPWSRKEFPAVAEWLDANEKALDRIIEATERPRLFLPLVSEDQNSALIGVNLKVISSLREFARVLGARAMLALEEGRIDEAQRNLLACHRLASLLGQQSTMIEGLVGYALDAVACEGGQYLAQSEQATRQQLASYRRQLAQLPPLAKMSGNINVHERFTFLDVISGLALQRDKQNFGEGLGLPNAKLWNRILGLSLDWDLIMKRGNAKYDQIVAALKQPTFAERAAAITKIEEELKALRAESQKPQQFTLMILGLNPPRKMASEQMGNVLITLMLPAVQQAHQAEVKASLQRELTLAALALGEYHREHGSYPEKLSELAPDFLKTIPQDAFTQQPLKYQRQAGGYLLYSVGPDGKDDQGQDRSMNKDADDLAVRVPANVEI